MASPLRLRALPDPEADESGVHGINERISIENVRTGTQMMYGIVKSTVGN